MENLLNIIYAVILASWSFMYPNRFVLGYLIYVSSYLGWFSGDIMVGGIEYGQFFFNLLALFPVIFAWRTIDTPLRTIILLLALFYLYGLVKPIIDGHQGWLLSVKSSKSMTTYFFLFYVLAFYNRLNWNLIFRFLTFVSLYYAMLYLINGIGVSIRPPMYIKEHFIQCPYDSFLLLSLCYQLAQEDVFHLQRLTVIVLLLGGIYIGGYFSLMVSSWLIVLGMLVYRSIHHPAMVILWIGTFLLILLYGVAIDTTLMQLWGEQQSALESRSHYNEFRWALIAKEFLGGYGFLSRDTRLVSLNASGENSTYMMDLSFIDAGYVDLMGRFGLIGTILFLLFPLYFMTTSVWNRQTLPFLLLILFFYVVNTTWSVFTFPHGIIVLAFVYAYLYQNKKHYGKNLECNIGSYADGRDHR